MRLVRRILLGLILLLVALTAMLYRTDLSAADAENRYLTTESRFITVADTRIHVRVRGTGPPVVLIHGSFSSLHTWQPWEDSLSLKFTTVSMDLPGHGLTGPDTHGKYSQDHYTEVVFSIADQLGLDTFTVAGNSMGGNVAYRMALQRPERISKLILVDAAGAPSDTSFRLSASADRPFIFTMLANPVMRKALTRLTPRFLFKSILKGVFSDPSQISESLVDRYYDLMLREGNREATALRLGGGRNATPKGNITCPTLILWGANDQWIPVSVGHRFHEAIPGSTMAIMENTGHVPMEERPAESYAIVKEFLEAKTIR